MSMEDTRSNMYHLCNSSFTCRIYTEPACQLHHDNLAKVLGTKCSFEISEHVEHIDAAEISELAQ